MKKDKTKEKVKGYVTEFKAFVSKGNVVDLAIGVIIGAAFGKIVTSLVNDIIMPIIGVFLGGLNFASLSIRFNSATIMYGSFIQNIIDFMIIAACIFIMVKFLNKFIIKNEKEEKKEKEVIKKSDEVILLEEIRDLLKKSSK